MMKLLVVTVLCCVVFASGIPHQLSFLVPERRSEVSTVNADLSALPYEYQIVPSNEYAVTVHQPESSILDYLLSPITAIVSVGSSALSVFHWVFVKGGLVLLGMSLVIAFCGLTSYCTLTVENPFSRGLPSIPYVDRLEYYFTEAYHKFHNMQD